MKESPSPKRPWLKPVMIAVASAPWGLMTGGVVALSHCGGEPTEEIGEPELAEIGWSHQDFLGQISDPASDHQCLVPDEG
jgi:hypothetical protein